MHRNSRNEPQLHSSGSRPQLVSILRKIEMAKAKSIKPPNRTNTEVREILLGYFYARNKNATSARGKRGFAIKIMDVRKELKASHGLSQQEVIGNLNYLISQRWIDEEHVEKSVPLPSGTVIPQSTSYYKITAAGIDKIEGPGEFTMPKFHGINISATGHNIITLGDGNQINAEFGDLGRSLADLREGISKSNAPEAAKLNLVADIETIQSQLAKPHPNRSILGLAWLGAKTAAVIDGCADLVHKTAGLILPYLS